MQIVLMSKSKNLLDFWKNSLSDKYSSILEIDDEKDLHIRLNKKTESIALFDSKFPYDIFILKTEYPKLKIFYLEDIPTFQKGKKILSLGVFGYANCRLSKVHLNQAIEFIISGNIWLYPKFMSELIQNFTSFSNNYSQDILSPLTNKEREIAILVSKGLTNKEIAKTTNIAESTVKVHLKSIYNKLNVTDRLSLALLLKQ